MSCRMCKSCPLPKMGPLLGSWYCAYASYPAFRAYRNPFDSEKMKLVDERALIQFPPDAHAGRPSQGVRPVKVDAPTSSALDDRCLGSGHT